MRQWAISVGINQYQFFQPLSYAQHDAQAIQRFLVDDANLPVEQCLLLTETSPPQWDKSTYPDRETIQSWLDFVIERCVQPGDVLWFFFSGYGICQQGQDYLMPIEGSPAAVQKTAIPLEAIFRSLRRASAATVLVLLDINRNESSFSHETVGNHTVHLASITGIPTILSCQPEQFSRETSALGHGFFTAALLESWRSRHCATVAALDQDLSAHLPELSERYWRPIQQPVTICPTEKQEQQILPAATFATHESSDRTAQRQANILNGTLAATAVQTLARPGTLDRMGNANGNGRWTAAAIATATPTTTERVAANGGGHINDGSHPYGETITASNPALEADPVSFPRGLNGSAIDSAHSNPAHSSNGATSAFTQSNGVGTRHPIDTATQNHENGVTYTNQTAAVTQPHSDDLEVEHEVPDALFWRSVLQWGGLAVVGLILGVLLRNCAAFTPKPSTAQQPTTSSTGQPKPADQTNTPQTGAVQAGTSQVLMGQAGTGQTPAATRLSTSITKSVAPTAPATTPVVKPLTPQSNASTQLGVSGTSRLNAAVGKTVAIQPQSIAAAGSASPDTLAVSSHLAKARALAAVNSNQASPYSDAIREASQVQPGQPDYAQAKQAIADWSSQILRIARQRGRVGQFDAAIVASRLIPQDQPAHAEAKSALDRWCPGLKAQRGANPVQRQQAKSICRKGIS